MDAIHRADSFIDALAGGLPVHPQDAADAELAVLLGTWRDEMRWPPTTDLISEADAVAALNAGRAEKRLGRDRQRWNVDTEITPRQNRRGLSVVGAAAAAVLCIGGFGAVVAGAGPGDGLYGLRTMLFGTPEVRDAQVGLAAKTTLNQVQDLISQGDWTQAQNKLVEVSSQVASIDDEQQKQDLLDQFNDLSAKVVERDPAATAPPGVVYTVPPSAAQLVPALAPATSTSPVASAAGEPSPSDSTTPTMTSSGSSSATSATGSPTSSAPASSDSEVSQTTTPTSGAPAMTVAPASTTAAPTTAVPSTSLAPAAAPESSAPASTPPASGEASAAPTATAPESTTAVAPATAGEAPLITPVAPAATTPVVSVPVG